MCSITSTAVCSKSTAVWTSWPSCKVGLSIFELSLTAENKNHTLDNVYRPLVSPDLKQELDQSNLQLGQIVTPVLELMYGVIDHVPANILPACLIFAHDHGI